MAHCWCDDDTVLRFSEKPPGDNALINGGFFVLHPDVLDRIEGDDTPWETEPLESLARDGELCAYPPHRVLAADGHAARQDHARKAVGCRPPSLEVVARLNRGQEHLRTSNVIAGLAASPGGVMTNRSKLLLGLLACVALPGAALAQNPQPAAPQVEHPPVAPPSSSQPPPEQIAPHDKPGLQSAQGDSMSDRLSKQQGTLHPPSVDPGISAPLPSHSQGSMPVIPPPGTPGGNPSVVPK